MDFVGTAEVAERLNVKQSTVHQWRHRPLEFPDPLFTLKTGPVWEWAAVREWAQATGRL